MDELNEPASNFRLSQVDFYNILSRGNQLSRSAPLQRIDPLPKKSISISLENGLQLGWAPNGYGKTFVFSTLLGLIQDDKDSDQSGIEGYHSYCERIFQKTNFRKDMHGKTKPIQPDKRFLLPFSMMGLKLESHVTNKTYSVLAVFETSKNEPNVDFAYADHHAFFIRSNPISDDPSEDNEHEDHNPNSHWVASSSGLNRFTTVYPKDKSSELLLEVAIEQFLSLRTTYLETPRLSMEAFTTQIQEYAYRFIGFEEYGIRGENDSFLHHTGNFVRRFSIPGELKVGGVEDALSSKDRSANYFFTKPHAYLDALQHLLYEVNDFTDALNPLDSTNEFDSSLTTFSTLLDGDEEFLDHHMIEIHTASFVQHFAGISRNILFTIGDFNNPIRYELFCNVLQFVRDHNFLTSPWKKRLICVLETLQLAYLSDNVTCSLQLEDAKVRLNLLLDDIDERPNNLSYLKFRAHCIRCFRAYKDGDEVKQAVSRKWIFDYKQKILQQPDDSTVDMFPSALDGAVVFSGDFMANQNTGLIRSLREKLDNIDSTKWNEVQKNFRERMSGGWEDVLWPKPKALETNYRFILDSINQIINTKDDPWGVNAKFIANHEAPIHFSPSQIEGNTLLPEFLSFGMRSEIILQCALCDFILQHRKSRMNPEISSNFELLIIDEAKVGRSEYWTQLLIKHMRRLEHQISDFKSHSVLVVSHRGLVLERSRKNGHYHVMYPLDYEEDMEI